MDKKSFIRGFGVGVLFAAVILGISFTVRTSDSFVASRAKELGMVYKEKEDDSALNLSKATDEPETEATKSPKKEDSKKKDKVESTPQVTPTKEPEATPSITPEVTATVKPTAKPTATPEITPKPTKKPKKDTVNKPAEKKYLTINVGDWSSDVSEKLENLGVIESAKDFDQYLNQNGYSSSIVAGTFEVSADDSYATLAGKITGR